jgi:tetratricopeptide (TPR) repeat protein
MSTPPRAPRRARPSRRFALALLLAGHCAPLAGCGAGDRVAEARELQAGGHFAESLAPLQAQLAEHPGDPEVQYLYGYALVQTGQLTLAQFALREAMRSREWLVPAATELASTQILTDNAEGAVEAATRILEVEPENLDALLLRARAYAMTRNAYESALADAERAIELDPGEIEGRTLRVVSLLGLERADEAETALSELESTARDADLEPTEAARFCAMRAVFSKEKGDAEEAERRFDACLERHPADFLVVKEAVTFFDERGKPERGEVILRAGLAEWPTAAVFRRALAERLRARGETAEAERMLREGTEMENPVLAVESWIDLGNHFHALGDHAAAAAALERAMAIHGKQDPQLVFDYADALVMAGRYDEALELARGMEVRPHRDLVEGRVALEQGRSAEALERFGAALRLWPDNEVARYYAAVAAERTGDFDRAVAEYRYSIRSDPDATDARERLARLHEAEGAGERALLVLQHDSRRSPAGLDAQLLAVRISARLGRARQLGTLLADLARRGELGAAAAAAAEGLRAREGAAVTADWLLEVPGLDLEDPRNARALRALVDCLAEAGRAEEGLGPAQSALAKHPEVAAFHSIHAAALRAAGERPEAVGAAYSRALELDPEGSAAALVGLARLAAEAGDPAAALDLYARAAALEPEDASAPSAAAELLLSLGRRQEAERQLAQALEREPYRSEAAVRLAGLLLERNADLDRALELAQRAVRFGGGAPAQELVARVLERRGAHDVARETSGPEPRQDP